MKCCTRCIALFTLLFSSLCFSEGARYLIITPDNFYNAILPLAEWKTKKGMKTKVAKLSQTGSSASQIRSYIIEAYNYWDPRPEYLLLVGDHYTIDMPYHGGTESDNYYTDIEGDLYNEIIPGRFPASNVNHVNTMVSKTLGYERTPYLDDTLWFRKGTVIIREDYDAHDDSIYWDDTYYAINNMLGSGYVVIDTLSRSGGDNSNDVENAMTDGRTFVQFRGQGVGNWWSPFNINVNNCSTGFKLPVVVSATCATYYGIGYDLLRAGTASSPKGGVGCAATSTVCCNCAYLRSPIAKAFVDGMFRSYGVLGLACEAAREKVYAMYPDGDGPREYNGLICLGDPELNLWTYTPESLSVSYPEVIQPGETGVTVTVQNNEGLTPVRNALVCLMMDTTVYEYAYTNADGQVLLVVHPQGIGDMEITVTARNCLPYEDTISVMPTGPYVIYLASSFADTINGNGDGVVNPGEEISLEVLVKNIGFEIAEGVHGTISIDTDFVTVLDSSDHFGDISPDSSKWGGDGFAFIVSPDCPPEYTIDILVDLSDTVGNHWEIDLPSLNVETGKLILDGTFVYDTLPGNNNDSIPNPGETVLLDIAVKNIGLSDLYNAEGIIRCGDDYVSMIDSIMYFDEIPSESTAVSLNQAEFTLSPLTPSGYNIPFELYTTEDGSTYIHRDTISFPLQVETGKLMVDTAIVYDTLPGDNGNSRLDPGETVHLDVAVKNTGSSALYGAEGVLRCGGDFVLMMDSILFFDEILPESTVLSSNHIEFIVSPLTVPGYDIPFELYTVEDGSTYTHCDTISFSLAVGEAGTGVPTGPDEYGYYCYDNTDTLYGFAPTYDWFEIAPPGPGSTISAITNEDARTATLSLPFDCKYYGTNHTTISVCSNGFLALGYTSYRLGDNSAIPDTHGPANMVAPFWFDLDPSEHGNIYQYYDEDNHRWICEFKNVAHYGAPSVRETFQAIILDPDYYETPTGDGEIIFQYEDVANPSTATVGIENSTQDIGIQYYYNYNYDPAAATIQDGRALKFTTNPPQPSETPWILFHDYEIDDSFGNNDGVANAGEDFKMYVYLENLGNITASSLNARLSVTDTLIGMDDSLSFFGDIPAGEVVGDTTDPYDVHISSDFTDTTALFYIYVESNGGEYGTVVSLTIEVGPPITGIQENKPLVYGLAQNFPNPMNSTTAIRYQIPRDGDVGIKIYNLAGMHVRTLVDGSVKAGVYVIAWDGRNDEGKLVPNGLYFYRMESSSYQKTRKLIKLR